MIDKSQLIRDLCDVVEAADRAVDLKAQLDAANRRIAELESEVHMREICNSGLIETARRPVVVQLGEIEHLATMASLSVAQELEKAVELIRREMGKRAA